MNEISTPSRPKKVWLFQTPAYRVCKLCDWRKHESEFATKFICIPCKEEQKAYTAEKDGIRLKQYNVKRRSEDMGFRLRHNFRTRLRDIVKGKTKAGKLYL